VKTSAVPTFVNEAVTRADFVRRHPRALGLYLLNGALFLALALAYALVVPGAPPASLSGLLF
jgi:hypothetical protein